MEVINRLSKTLSLGELVTFLHAEIEYTTKAN